jgi:hypothetical protein
MLATMLELEAFAGAQASQNPHFPFWMLTLRLGIAMTRAALDWGESALAQLASMETAAQNPRPAASNPTAEKA